MAVDNTTNGTATTTSQVARSMAKTIPCPNPTCTHDFTLAEVQTAAQLLCPKCGFSMQGKAVAQPKPTPKPPPPKPAAPKPAIAPVMPTAKPTPPIAAPLAAPVAPPLAVPVVEFTPVEPPAPATGEASQADSTFFNPDIDGGGGTLIRTNQTKKKFSWLRMSIVILSVGFAISIVVGGIALVVILFLGPRGLREDPLAEPDSIIGKIKNSKNEQEKVYKLVLPRVSWAYDGEIRHSFKFNGDVPDGIVAAFKNSDYKDEFWLALVAKDYGMHKPRDAEMLRICIEKLENHFGEALELGAKAEPAKFGTTKDALPTQKLQFRGVLKEAKWVGECSMFFNNGIAYWLFIASPDAATVQYFAGELPDKHIFVVSERRGWREQPWPTDTFATADGKIEMTAPKGVWERSDDPKSEDPNGIVLLAGTYRLVKDNRRNALLLVFTLDKQEGLDAALKAVRDHLDEKAKGEGENYKFMHAPEIVPGQKETGTLENVGNKRGRVVDLKYMFKDEPQRYHLLSVVSEPDRCYAILCSCDWKYRPLWREDFRDVLRTMRLK